MPATTPIARSKTAALARVLDCVPKGYHRYTCGTVAASKAVSLAKKFHHLYGIGCTPAQRLIRKGKGQSNALLVLYWPVDTEEVEWLLLVTDGTGLETEDLRRVDEKPRLRFLAYEMVRHSARGKATWTWRRPKHEMEELHALLAYQARQHRSLTVAGTLERIARQPGFHGVRKQTQELFREARRRGYTDILPRIYFVQKVSHGERIKLTST
jgi:hypothetical protein